jgi:methionine sulfoxide reductase heme-binding subunit
MIALGANTGSGLWYLTRGSGAVALILLTLSLVLGVLTTFESAPARIPHFVIPQLHRNVSLAVLVFVALHFATTVLDGYVDIVWIDALLPFASSYHPLWLALGTLSFDLLLVITLTSLLRSRIRRRAWRFVHLFSYAAWPLAIVHGWFIGTDSATAWLRGVDLACLATVALVVARRVVRPPRAGAQPGESPIGAKARVTAWAHPRHQLPQGNQAVPYPPTAPGRQLKAQPRAPRR